MLSGVSGKLQVHKREAVHGNAEGFHSLSEVFWGVLKPLDSTTISEPSVCIRKFPWLKGKRTSDIFFFFPEVYVISTKKKKIFSMFWCFVFEVFFFFSVAAANMEYWLNNRFDAF